MLIFKESGKKQKIIGHVSGWLFFICYDTGYLYFSMGTVGHVYNLVFFYACNIILFYIHYYVLNLTVGREKPQYGRAILLGILELVLFMVIKSGWEILVTPIDQPFDAGFPFMKHVLLNNLVRSTYYAGISTMVWSSGHLVGFRKKAINAEMQKFRAERDHASLEAKFAAVQNAYLRQQLNPHLLLNTLGFIHHSAFQYSESAADMIHKLTEILRFSLAPGNEDGKVELTREIEQVRNLVDINRHRFHDELLLDVQFTVKGTPLIIPLVLLTLTENMFKYGDFRHQSAFLRLSVDERGLLKFSTFNAKRNPGKTRAAAGIGMKNTRLRLDYTYGTAYQLTTTDDPDSFRLDLIIAL